ncbi:DUF2523 domain-containing protein [Iodobacter sp. CM08]|uniref:DUF2523 domain-containing protein n=1 Tax=Iodobacter sp. CM08 TaxID=3085902 RepID=UPI0029812030|nr:DUF2523 domain-containing protein [Iodobacter sp. CM08]MDW5418877.1 DUF2523 domain-containing protein [Iodobacter sp. CM08]
MPALLAIPWIAALIGGLVSAAASFAGRALIGLGVGVVTYTGFKIVLDKLQSDLISNFKSLPIEIMQVLGVLQVDTCVSILFSAYLGKLVVSGLSSGSVKKWVTK